MRRRLLIGASIVLGLLTLLALSVFIYIRSGRLDHFLQNEIVKNLAEVGIRAEIGNAHLDLSRPYKVILQDIKLYAGDRAQPFCTIDRIEGRFSVLNYLRQKVKIVDVVVEHPHLWVEIDKQGKLNLDALHSPPETKKKPGSNVSLLNADYKIEDGEVTLVDKRQDVTAEMRALSISFTPNDPNSVEDILNNTLDLSFKGGTATYQGRPVQHLDGQVKATLRESAADISTLRISSDLGELTGQGRVDGYRPLKYDFRLSSALVLDQLSYLLKPGMRLGGKAALRGQVSGTDSDYHLTGEVMSGGLDIEGFTIQGIKVATDLHGHDATLKGTAQFQSAEASGAGTKAGPMKLGATVSVNSDRFELAGGLVLAKLQRGQITVDAISGRIDANRDRGTIRDLSASVMGGTVTGSASLGYGGGESRADLDFKSIDLERAAGLASARDVNIQGTANGTASVTFPGLRLQQATGRLDLQFDASISRPEPGAEKAPATGKIDVVANGRLLNVDVFVRSANSDVTASGTLDWDGVAALNVGFKSQDMAEVQRALDALGLIPDDVKLKYELGLEGPGEFDGRITGNLAQPDATGRLTLSNLKAHGQDVGSFTGDVVFAPSLLRVKEASIIRPDGSEAQFSLELPIPVDNNVSVTAKLTDFDLHTLSAVAAPELADFVARGVLTGNVNLTGLPGPRTIRGDGIVSLSAAEFNVPSQEGEDQTRKVSVPLLTGKATFDNSVLSVQGVEMRIDSSTVSGDLSFNLDTYEYSVKAGGQNIDLSRLGHAVSDTLDLTGQAEITVRGQGNWDDWSTTNVTAVIQGHNVALNTRELGDARLEAHTDNGLLKVEATGKVLDRPRTLDAIVDLRDRKNYPVSARIEFTDEDVGPYLGLIAPKLESISGKATGTITLTGPLQDPDQLKAIAHLSKLEIGGAVAEGRRYTIANQGDIDVTATMNEISINRVTFVGEDTSVTVGGAIGREEGGGSALTVDGTLDLRLISSFSAVLYTTGLADLHATVQGTLGSPRLYGFANLKNIGVRLLDFPVSMARGNGTIRFTSDQAAIENFTASTPGGGRLTISGGAALAALVPDRWRLQMAADQVTAEYPQDTQTIFDGTVVLQGNRQLQVLSGDIRIRRALYTKDVTLSDLISNGGPFNEQFIQAGPGGGGGPGPRINLDIRVDADNSIVLRNNLVDAIGSSHLRLSGPIDDPVASGRIQLDHGTTEFQNYRYEITRALITFPSTRGAEPIIDLQAEADIGGYHVTIPFSGIPSHLHVAPRSDPQLPANDLIALILTGRPTGDTSTTAAASMSSTQSGIGLAQTLLSATLSQELGRQTQRIFGISRVSIDPLVVGTGGQPTARVTISQKINRNLSFTYSQNVTSGPTGLDQIVLVEYYLSNRLSIIGIRDEQLGSTGFNVRLRKRF